MELREDAWLAEILEVPCFQAVRLDDAVQANDVRRRLLFSADGKPAFFFAKVPTADTTLVAALTQAGFRVADVNVTLDWTTKTDAGFPRAVEDVEVNPSLPADSDEIENIAGRCFTYSRFHLDPFISQAQANEVKRQWARNACRGRAAVVYAARYAGALSGFLAVMVSGHERKDAVIDLIGVDATHQGRGVGRALSRAFIGEWKDRADRLRVGTQVSNIPALRLYESLGFRVSETSYVLHAHVRDGAFCA